MSNLELCGRTGLSHILGESESTTRNLQKAGLIAPELVIGGRPLFSVAKAQALRALREAARANRGAGRSAA
jgi:hypothetical protein